MNINAYFRGLNLTKQGDDNVLRPDIHIRKDRVSAEEVAHLYTMQGGAVTLVITPTHDPDYETPGEKRAREEREKHEAVMDEKHRREAASRQEPLPMTEEEGLARVEGYGAVYGLKDGAEGFYRVRACDDEPGRFCAHLFEPGQPPIMTSAEFVADPADAQESLDEWAEVDGLPLLHYALLPVLISEDDPVEITPDGVEALAAEPAPADEPDMEAIRREFVTYQDDARRSYYVDEVDNGPGLGVRYAVYSSPGDGTREQYTLIEPTQNAEEAQQRLDNWALAQGWWAAGSRPEEMEHDSVTDPFESVPDHPAQAATEPRKRGRPRKVAGLDKPEQPAANGSRLSDLLREGTVTRFKHKQAPTEYELVEHKPEEPGPFRFRNLSNGVVSAAGASLIDQFYEALPEAEPVASNA